MTVIARVLLLFAAFALAIAPGAVRAEPSDGKPSASADAAGRAHFQRGQRLSASGQYAAAYREFAAGYAASKRPLFLFNMAEAARANGDTAKAREAYLEFLRVDSKNALAATARTRLAELDRGAVTPSRPGPTSPDGPATRPDAPADTSATGLDASRAPPSTPGGAPSSVPGGAPPSAPGAPSISTGGARTEPIPFMPPSATRPHPEPEGLPPERFTAERADAEDRPLWKKWPFWAVVGGVVAGGAVVFAVTRDHGTVCGPGCSQIDFR